MQVPVIPLGPGESEKRPWQTFATFLSVGRPHITAIAALGTFTFGWLFLGEYPWFLTAVCALDWYIVNLTNRIADLQEDQANRIFGTRFAWRHRRPLLAGILLVLIASIVLVHLIHPAITPLRIAGHLLAMFYNWRVLPGGRRLKEMYFFKNTASAMGFMITVFGYPVATLWEAQGALNFPPGIRWATVGFAATFFFLFEISYEVIYDLRDVAGDRWAGVRTYPAVHGVRVAEYIVDGLIAGSMAVLAAGYALGAVPWRIFIMIAVPPIQFVIYKRAMARGGITAKDCLRITWLGVILIIVYHCWVLAGLPGAGL
jgi:4-hydroxybenzoate polyprenyltransferase